MSAQFKVRAADARVVARLRQRFGLPEFIATIMAARGIDDEQAQRFLNPSLDRDWREPYELPGIGPVVDALEKVASARGISMAQTALAWHFAKPEITAPIVGFTSVQHVEEAVAALDVKLTPEEIAALEAPYKPHIKTGAF